jgi:DNA invertase Pin-like site-specific DNA recombinase
LKSDRTKAGLARARREGRIGPRLVLDRDRVLKLDEDGYAQEEIAGEMGCSQISVSRILRGYKRLPGPSLI